MGRELLLVFLLVLFWRLFPEENPSPAVAAATVAEAPSPVTALFVLGDSSVNCGENTFFYPLLPANFSSTFCSGSGRRFLPDLIAEQMGLPPIPPFYSANGTAEGLSNGVNFGSTPATILSGSIATGGGRGVGGLGYGYGLFLFQTLSQQVRQAFDTLQLLHLRLGPSATSRRTTASSALFLLSFGTDDFATLLAGDTPAPKYGRRGLARLLVSHMVQAVKDLYNADARRIAVLGVGPLGCAPRAAWETGGDGMDGGGCVGELNELIAAYNAKLASRLARLGAELPDARIVFCDVYNGTMEIISNPQIYGFGNVRDACCGAGPFGGMIECLSREMACEDPRRHVWWDLYGPTEAVNELLASWSWSPPEPRLCLCSPLSLQRLASRGPVRPGSRVQNEGLRVKLGCWFLSFKLSTHKKSLLNSSPQAIPTAASDDDMASD